MSAEPEILNCAPCGSSLSSSERCCVHESFAEQARGRREAEALVSQSQAGLSNVETILEFARGLYRAAREAPADTFQDVALAALATQIRFEAAVWFAGELSGGQFHFHRLHLLGLPQQKLQHIVSSSRQFLRPLEISATHPGVAHEFYAPDLYTDPESVPALECARRLHLERQLLVACMDGRSGIGEWLSLHRPANGESFSEHDRTMLKLLMPHLSEARTLNRALSLDRASRERFFSPGSHRALTLLDGTILHCGRQVSDSIASEWPDWNQIRLPPRLLETLARSGSVPIARRGEAISARPFTDCMVLTVKGVPLAERLTRREYEVVQLFGAGKRYKEIARRCGLAPTTVRNVLQKAYRKLSVNSKYELAQLIRESAHST